MKPKSIKVEWRLFIIVDDKMVDVIKMPANTPFPDRQDGITTSEGYYVVMARQINYQNRTVRLQCSQFTVPVV